MKRNAGAIGKFSCQRVFLQYRVEHGSGSVSVVMACGETSKTRLRS
jgi:hypothetical protein